MAVLSVPNRTTAGICNATQVLATHETELIVVVRESTSWAAEKVDEQSKYSRSNRHLRKGNMAEISVALGFFRPPGGWKGVESIRAREIMQH